jgi:uncharacterized peroxidase-related enzyme
MTFITTIPEEQAMADVKTMYANNVANMGYLPEYVKVYSHRPQVMEAWGNLLGAIRGSMDTRRYELVTLAAARALRSSYCMLAHGSILARDFYTSDQLTRIAQDYETTDLTPAEAAMMAFAEQIVHDATAMTQQDIDVLRGHGFSDPEIFDITATATARCFFSKILDALGAEPDPHYLTLDEPVRQALTVGRPIRGQDG